MPGRWSLCRRVAGACARARLTPDPVPLSRAGLSSLRTVRGPCTLGERARSLSAQHLVHTAHTSRPRPMHTTYICLVRVSAGPELALVYLFGILDALELEYS